MAPYSISISNKSGEKQSYAIFAEAPSIKASSSSNVIAITGIITSVHGVANGRGQASFILSKKLYATCGTYDVDFDSAEGNENKSPVGTGTEVVDQRPVILGYKDPHGKEVQGSLLEVDSSGGAPAFASGDGGVGAELDCFAIRTQGDFTATEAKLNKFVIGFSSSLKHSIGPYATFVPAPNQTYQIKPSKVFYVTVGSFNPRDLTKPENLKQQHSTCSIDFASLATDDVQLIHDEHNNLQIAMLTDD